MGYIEFIYRNNKQIKKKARFKIKDNDTLEILSIEDFEQPKIIEKPIYPKPSEFKTRHGVGEIVASFTKLFGFKPCAPCNKRRQYLNKKTPDWIVKIIERIYIGKEKNKK